MVKVSIAIPFYNAEKYLATAIQSVINQSYYNWELLLIDDGSTDNSINIASSFLFDVRVKVISDHLNKGLVYRLNQSVGLSKGIYYARMDADDVMHTERIRKQIEYLDTHSTVDVAGTNIVSIDSKNNIHGIIKYPETIDSFETLFYRGCFAHPSIMGKLDWFKVNPYIEQYIRMEDFELWARTLNCSNFKNIQEPLLYYRDMDNFSFNKYYASNKGILLYILNGKFNVYQKIMFSARIVSKIISYFILFVLGMEKMLIKMRSNSSSGPELAVLTSDFNSAIY